jgi:4-hydroxybenzoate polyprenyltransferase
MTLLTQIVVLYAILIPSGLELALSTYQFALLICSVALLTASGNVINDIHDVDIDRVNKPDQVIVGVKITEKAAYNYYIIITSLAVVLGFIVSNSIEKPIFSSVFILVAFLLYTYATTLKALPIIGNILISLLVALVILITGVFELMPVITDATKSESADVMKILFYFGVMAFIINLLREWIKDCEDVNGDKAGGRLTIGLLLGRSRAAKFIALCTWALLLGMVYIVITYLYLHQVSMLYWILLLMAPLMYVAIQLWNAEQPTKFKTLTRVLKVVLLLGIFYMFIYNVNQITDF